MLKGILLTVTVTFRYMKICQMHSAVMFFCHMYAAHVLTVCTTLGHIHVEYVLTEASTLYQVCLF